MKSDLAIFEDFKIRRTYDAKTETLLRLIQSVPSHKAMRC